MVRQSTIVAGVVGSVLAAAAFWNLYQRYSTETVPYTVVAHVDTVELRRYPDQVLVETYAPTENVAFRRLFQYISGANDGGETISMTTPVEVGNSGTSIQLTAPFVRERIGRSIPMTAPVEIGRGSDTEEVRMAFYLPEDYDVASAPLPTNDDVKILKVPERTLAVKRFTWRPTDARVALETARLLEALKTAGFYTAGESFFLGYDAPWTLPFLRRNEVAVKVEANTRS